MLVIFVRTIILYLLVVIVMRIMGKRQIGQLQPFELVVAIMLSELAAIPMQNQGIPLINGIIPITTLLFMQIILSYLNLKSERAREIICGKPSIVIKNGLIVEDELKNLKYSINDLLEQLRVKDCPNIKDVEFAILETSGELSVIPRSQKRPLTPKDVNIPTSYEGIPLNLIQDGRLNTNNLRHAKLTEEWLKGELKKQNINSIKEVFLCSLDTDGTLFIQKHSVGDIL